MTNTKLFALTYISFSTIIDDDLPNQLRQIQTSAESNNSRHKVSGKLIVCNHFFVQRLEGFEDDINRIFKTIEEDSRHRAIKVIFHGPIHYRLFPNWHQMEVISSEEKLDELNSFLLKSSLIEKNSISDQEAAFILHFIERFKDSDSANTQ